MQERLRNALYSVDTDLEGALDRFYKDEELYVNCLKSFLEDETLGEFENALAIGDWDTAFTAIHSIKGFAGNMGFVPLYLISAKIVILIRSGNLKEVVTSLDEMKKQYKLIKDAIKNNITSEA